MGGAATGLKLAGPKEINSLMDLPRRQRQVLTGIAVGLSVPEIAKQLGISPKTVEIHRHLGYIALEVTKNTQVTALFFRWGLLK